MNNIIEFRNDGIDFVGIPKQSFDQLINKLESLGDLKDYQTLEASKTSGEEMFPLELTTRIINGENPITTYREYRKLSKASLGSKAGVSGQYISMIESGKRTGDVHVLKKIAIALNVDLDMLVD